MNKVYKWSLYQEAVPADVVGSIMEEIEEEFGAVTKENFLDRARPSDSPTHALFEWNDAVAAEKYRLGRSGRIINNLDIQITHKDNKPRQVRAFVNVSDGKDKGSFIGIVRAMSNNDTRRRVINNALAELNAFKAKYASYKEFAGVFKEIDKLKGATA